MAKKCMYCGDWIGFYDREGGDFCSSDCEGAFWGDDYDGDEYDDEEEEYY